MNSIKLLIIACCLISCTREGYDLRIDINSGLKPSTVASVYLIEQTNQTRIIILSDSGQKRHHTSKDKDLLNLIAQTSFEEKPQFEDVDKPSFVIYFKNESDYKYVGSNSELYTELSSFFSSMEKVLLITE